MDALKQYLIPYVLSNILFMLCLTAAIKKPILARLFLSLVFLWAASINFRTASVTPEVYLEYSGLTLLSFYRHFINGFFSQHIKPFVFLMASGESGIFIGLVLNKGFVRMACIGGMVFGLAIAPLGVGSAFPATVTMAFAFWALYNKKGQDYIWKWRQYTGQVQMAQKNPKIGADEITSQHSST